MTSLSLKSVRRGGLFGLFVAVSGAFWWSGAAWAQHSPVKQCWTPNPQCTATAQSDCQQQAKSSSSPAYSSCVSQRFHQCQLVLVPCP
jgi:hypothetical protein